MLCLNDKLEIFAAHFLNAHPPAKINLIEVVVALLLGVSATSTTQK